MKKRATSNLDQELGRRVRVRRIALGMTQERLGELLGVAFQQVQKYENGKNRISAAGLYSLGRILKVPVDSFYRDGPVLSAEAEPDPLAALATPESVELAHIFSRIRSKAAKRSILDYARAAAALEALIEGSALPKRSVPRRGLASSPAPRA